MGFTKLDEGILQSSVMLEEPPTFKVWIALLASCGPDGIARVSSVFLSSVCHLDLDTVDKALEILETPDPRSRSMVEEGRRVKRVDGGYFIVNYEKYRAFTYSMSEEAIRKRAWRAKSGTSVDNSGQRPDNPGTPRDIPGQSASASASSSLSSARKKEAGLAKMSVHGGRRREVLDILAGKELKLNLQTIDYITDLTLEFQDVDWKEEIERKIAHLKDHPLKQGSNVALQFRNWFVNARKFAAERTRNDQVGAQQPAGASPPVPKDDFRVAQEAKISEIMEKYRATIEAIESEDPFDPHKLQRVKNEMRGELDDWTSNYLKEKNEHIQPGSKEEDEGPL
jgi:hypothetical protein